GMPKKTANQRTTVEASTAKRDPSTASSMTGRLSRLITNAVPASRRPQAEYAVTRNVGPQPIVGARRFSYIRACPMASAGRGPAGGTAPDGVRVTTTRRSSPLIPALLVLALAAWLVGRTWTTEASRPAAAPADTETTSARHADTKPLPSP